MTEYIIEKGWKCINEEGCFCGREDLEETGYTLYLYKDDEIWRFRNGRCRQTSFKRFEDTLRKALKFGEKIRKRLIFQEDCVRYEDGTVIVRGWHREELKRLGLVVGDKINIPEKFTTAQKHYALEYFEEILTRTV